MLSLSEGISRELIEHGAVVVVALVTLAGVIYQSRKTRGQLGTGNGHSIGEAVARIEETQWRHEQRLDSIEVEIREASTKLGETHALGQRSVWQMEDHLAEIAPFKDWVAEQMKGEG